MKYEIFITVAILTVFAVSFTFGQAGKPSPQMVAANKLVQEKKWNEAEKALSIIVKSEPKNGRAWFMLGLSRHSQENFNGAIEAFKKTVEIAKSPFGMYNAAAGYSRLDKKDEAFEWLEKSLNNGAAFSANLADNDFDNIREDTRFAEMEKIIHQKKNPCLYSKEARQFDFWIGDWDVFVQGQKVGENLVEVEVGGCTLVENWKNNQGGTGKSLNSYNAGKKKWQQYYVGSQGGVLEFEGELKGNVMSFTAETINPNGSKTMHIFEFHDLPDKTVRQSWQQSTDDGKTWNMVWDSIYKKRKS
jgi:tetratricopeptide (TPR) repeat protein